MWIVIDTFNIDFWNVISDEEGKTFFFTERTAADKYGKENCQTYIVVNTEGQDG